MARIVFFKNVFFLNVLGFTRNNKITTFISNKQKCHVFLFNLFSSAKSENRRVEQVLPSEEVGTSVGGRMWERG
jgi:hypothetical protein